MPLFAFPHLPNEPAATPAPFAAQRTTQFGQHASTPAPPLLSGSPQPTMRHHDAKAAELALKTAQCCKELNDAKAGVKELEAVPESLRGPAIYSLLGELHHELGNKKHAELAFKVRLIFRWCLEG